MFSFTFYCRPPLAPDRLPHHLQRHQGERGQRQGVLLGGQGGLQRGVRRRAAADIPARGIQISESAVSINLQQYARVEIAGVRGRRAEDESDEPAAALRGTVITLSIIYMGQQTLSPSVCSFV